MADEPVRRHSRPVLPDLIHDPRQKAEQKSLNALRQYDETKAYIRAFIEGDRPFKLRPSLILGLHRTALDGISSFAGNYRPGPVEIEASRHVPPDANLVAELMEDFCDYINDNWEKASAVHLSAYAMWRINWIHPFADGNGRTSRAISYFVLCVKLNELLPGTNTIPDQITANRDPYFAALDAADAAFKEDRIDVSAMEELIEELLGAQLYSVVARATEG